MTTTFSPFANRDPGNVFALLHASQTVLRGIGRCALILGILMGMSSFSSAEEVFLADSKGAEVAIGKIAFDDNGGYRLTIDHDPFKDFFLSMKEMKCLEGREVWCHIPYPYSMPRTVEGDDFRWLSQDLLFMYKSPGEFGANFWQGIYYQIERAENELRGTAMHVDLNELASPPDTTDQPFFDEAWLEPVDGNDHWLPTLIIR